MTDAGGIGQQTPIDTQDEFSKHDFHIDQKLLKVNTAKVVTVVAVYDAQGNPVDPNNTGSIGAVGFVDVRPLVNMIDGAGNNQEHGVIYKVPVNRIQGGGNAIICDPQIGDVGKVSCADRDISSVVANRDGKPAPPGSKGTHRAADAIYDGNILNDTPVQGLRFLADGLQIFDKNGNTITFSPDGVVLKDASGSLLEMKNGDMTVTPQGGTFKVNGDLNITGEAYGQTAGGAGVQVGLTTHTHHQPNDSHGDTEQPTLPPSGGT